MTEVKGFMFFNKENKNGRIYQQEIMADAIKDYKKLVDRGVAVGELGHPSSFETDLMNASHQIVDAHLVKAKLPRKAKKSFIKAHGRDSYQKWRTQNGGLVTTAVLLNTRAGKLAKDMKDHLVLSPRGAGRVNEKGEIVDYKLHTFDLINTEEYAFKQRR